MKTWQRLNLQGLEPAPPQLLGSIRMVPLIRRNVVGDLRLSKRVYDDTAGIVADADAAYSSFIPHGMIMQWSEDGTAVVSSETEVQNKDTQQWRCGPLSVRVMHRMARRESKRQLRFLPLHVAMEGFLGVCFSGPDIQWPEYSRRVIARGLSPRSERSVSGHALGPFKEALRVFEVHEDQVGVMLFVGEALASIFVVPHPADYKALHSSLLDDFYGVMLLDYGWLYPQVFNPLPDVSQEFIRTLDDVKLWLSKVRTEHGDYARALAADVLDVAVTSEHVYTAGRFQLQRFMTSLEPGVENHLGEVVLRDDGSVEYLKTYRLSDAQVRRAYLLLRLRSAGWNLDQAAVDLKTTKEDLIRRIASAGFAGIFKPHIVTEAFRAGG